MYRNTLVGGTCGLLLFLFVLRDVPQASTTFSPFKLVLKEGWEQPPSQAVGVRAHCKDLRTRLLRARRLALENLQEVKQKQKSNYDKTAREREFQVGDTVLVLLPTSASKLLTKRQGPFEIIRCAKPVDYEVLQPRHQREREIFCVNLLKA